MNNPLLEQTKIGFWIMLYDDWHNLKFILDQHHTRVKIFCQGYIVPFTDAMKVMVREEIVKEQTL